MQDRLVTCLVLGIVIGLGAPTYAADQIELLDGTMILGDVHKVQAMKVVIKTRPEGSLLEIPLKYLAPMQQYKIRLLRLKPGDLDPQDHNIRIQLGKWCFEHNEWDNRLLEEAKTQFKLAEEYGGQDAKEIITAYLETHNIKVDQKGNWVSAEAWHKAQGHVRDPQTGKWMTKEEWEKIQAQEAKELKTKLLVANKNDYQRVCLPILTASRSVYADRDKQDKYRKVRFWSHFLFTDPQFGRTQAEALGTLGADKYVRILLAHEDCPEVYVEKKKYDGKVLKKLGLFRQGDRILVFGWVYLTENGFLILVDDIISG
ncbi:MAG: hypothetical protein ACYTHM_17115 [Planctomycetota bacterium]